MVIDTSALVAILTGEDDAEKFERAITTDLQRFISAATLVELGIVIEARYGEAGGRDLDLLIQKSRIQVVSVDEEQANLAREAYRRFGKGRHAAALNFGDCFSYALATSKGDTLLFKGKDFALTDVSSALSAG